MAGKVLISSEAFAAISLHASSHTTTAVHGVLVGSYSGDTVQVDHAFPICHETPTLPLLDTALALVSSEISDQEAKDIVGWFTSPELLADQTAGPVALRIVANLATDESTKDPILLVLNSEKMGEFLADDKLSASDCIQAYGKDFGQQWMKNLETSVEKEVETTEVTKKLIDQGFQINDLTNHLEDITSQDWDHSIHLASGALQGYCKKKV